jgi:O-antigen/teichoic acid export membrane protein
LRTIFKNWSLLTVSSIVQQGVSFLCLIRIARILAPELYGTYVYILTAAGIAQTVAVLGLRQIIIREIVRNQDSTPYIAGRVYPTLAVSAFVSSALLVLYFVMFTGISSVILLSLGLVLVLSQGIWNFSESLAFGWQQMQISSILNVLSSVSWFIFIFILPASAFSVDSVLGSFAGVQLIRAIIYVVIEFRLGYFAKKSSSLGGSYPSTLSLLRQSLPLFGTALLTIPISQLPILFLGHYSGMADVGLYGVGNRLIVPLSLISSTLMTAVYPALAKSFNEDKVGFQALVDKLFLAISLLGITTSWAVSCFSPEIVLLAFGQQYAGAIQAFSVQIWVALNLIAHSFLGTLFVAANYENLMVKLSAFNAVVTGVAGYVGAQHHASGVAVGLWVGLLFSFVVHRHYLVKNVGIRLSRKLQSIVFPSYMVLSIAAFLLADSFVGYRLLFLASSVVVVSIYHRSLFLRDLTRVGFELVRKPIGQR